MQKRQYEKPAMRVIALQQRQLLMVSGEISGYQKSCGNGFSQSEEDPNWP